MNPHTLDRPLRVLRVCLHLLLAGLLVLGQRLSLVQLVGMALVVVASVLVLGLGAARKPKAELPV